MELYLIVHRAYMPITQKYRMEGPDRYFEGTEEVSYEHCVRSLPNNPIRSIRVFERTESGWRHVERRYQNAEPNEPMLSESMNTNGLHTFRVTGLTPAEVRVLGVLAERYGSQDVAPQQVLASEAVFQGTAEFISLRIRDQLVHSVELGQSEADQIEAISWREAVEFYRP